MKGPLSKPTVKLVGEDGNAFSIMGRVKKALMRAVEQLTQITTVYLTNGLKLF